MTNSTVFPQLLLLVLLVFSSTIGASTLRFAAMDYCPYTCDPSKENGKEGVMVDVIRAAFEEAGYKIEYDILPFSRALKMVKEGKYDGIAGVGKIHADLFVFPDAPTYVQRLMFMVKPDTEWRYAGYNSLSDITLLIISGYDYAGSAVSRYVLENPNSENIVKLHGFNTTERGLKMLNAGRVGAYIEGEVCALYNINKYSLTNSFSVAGYTALSYEMFTAFSPKSPDAKKLARILSDKIKSLRKSGRLDAILANYGVHIQSK